MMRLSRLKLTIRRMMIVVEAMAIWLSIYPDLVDLFSEERRCESWSFHSPNLRSG
jgi:hypothetical protein